MESCKQKNWYCVNCTCVVMVSMLTSSAVDIVQIGLNQTIKLVFVASLLSTTALRRKSIDWLARNRNNVSKWGDISIRGLLCHSQ